MRRRHVYILGTIAGVAASSLGVLTLLPSGHDRERAEEVMCRSNLVQIGQAIRLYAGESGGAMPDSFATLLRTQDLVPEVFVCPDDGGATRATSVEAFAADLGPSHCSYVYFGDGLTTAAIRRPDEVVIAFERSHHAHERTAASVLFADGHVEALYEPRGDARAARWWAEIESRVARGERQLRLPDATTLPTR